MKNSLRKIILPMALMLSFFIGSYNGRLALWKGDDPTPCKVFPCPIILLPQKVQDQLKYGVRLDTMDDVNRFLENFLS